MEAVFDPYLIAGTQVLRNLVGATTMEDLRRAESELCVSRAMQLHAHLPKAQGTISQLQWIHHVLFQDIYDWAGAIRTVDIAKGEGLPFQPLAFFNTGVAYCEQMLREDNLLQRLSRDIFVKRLSVHYNNFNILHPFREGNGRTQRVFWDIVARDAGWHLDWGLVTGERNDQASIAGMQADDLRDLESMFDDIVKPLTIPLEADVPYTHLADELLSVGDSPNIGYTFTDEDYRQWQSRHESHASEADVT
ncbi:Fic/DOC family protein [Bifidobacterium lemurum]|nr:Fic family protein [Bifidobacterium lemurum]QOL35474.1 Fic family protein [Bifidobacterium lemurum]